MIRHFSRIGSMFFHSRTHQNLSNQAKSHMEVHFLSIELVKRHKNSNEPFKLPNNWNAPNKSKNKKDEPIIFSKEEDESNKTRNKAKAPNRNVRKDLRHVLRVHMDMEMEEIDGKERRLMWL